MLQNSHRHVISDTFLIEINALSDKREFYGALDIVALRRVGYLQLEAG